MGFFPAIPRVNALQKPVKQNAGPTATAADPELARAEDEARKRPEDSRVLLQLALLYHDRGSYGKSLSLLERVITLQPDSLDVLRLLGMDRFHAGHPAEALSALLKVFEANAHDGETNFYMGLCYLALDREEEARKAFDRLAEQAPSSVDELYFLTKAYTRISAAMLSRLAAQGKNSYRMHQVRGEYFDLQHAQEQAIQEYEKAVELRPDLASLHYILGTAYWKHSGAEKATVEFRRAIELDPRHYMARYELGMALLEQNDSPDAMKEFRAALAEQPGLANAYLGLGKTLFRQGEDNAAVLQLDHYIQLAPDDPTPHYLLYQIYRRQHRTQEADRELAVFNDKKARKKNEENPAPDGGLSTVEKQNLSPVPTKKPI